MAVGDWIEGAGIEGHNRGGFRSQGGSVSDRLQGAGVGGWGLVCQAQSGEVGGWGLARQGASGVAVNGAVQ
jgi:hypothetical protein